MTHAHEESRDPERSQLEQNQDDLWMELAIEQARLAEKSGEVPVGAVLIKDGMLLAKGHNRNLLDSDPTAHAEIVVLREAAAKIGNYRLGGCELFVTIEPCSMCAGAVMHARLDRVIYGAGDPKAGAAGSVLQILNHPKLNHTLEVRPGVLAEKCSDILKTFFQSRRKAQEQTQQAQE